MVRQLGISQLRVAVGFQVPDTGAPLIALLDRHLFRQIHAFQAREAARQLQRFFFRDIITGQQATVLGALLTQNARQAAGIDAGDGNNAVLAQVVIQRLLAAPVAGEQWQVADNQTGGLNRVGLDIFGSDTGITDVGIGQRHNLTRIGGIGEDLLVTGHGRVEHDLANTGTVGADGLTAKNAAVGECENGWLGQENLRKN